jgi:hypothetical protein
VGTVPASPPAALAALPPAMPPEQIAGAVTEFVADDRLAGRVMVCQAGEPHRLLPVTA